MVVDPSVLDATAAGLLAAANAPSAHTLASYERRWRMWEGFALHHGVPVLVVMHSNNTDKKGKAVTGTTTMHSTNLVRGDIPASTFEIPAGYSKYEPPSQPQH